MNHVHSITTEHKKGKHLSYDERMFIQIRVKDGWSANKIAKELGCVLTLQVIVFRQDRRLGVAWQGSC